MKIETSIKLNFDEDKLWKELIYEYPNLINNFFTMKKCPFNVYYFCDEICTSCIKLDKFTFLCSRDNSEINLLEWI